MKGIKISPQSFSYRTLVLLVPLGSGVGFVSSAGVGVVVVAGGSGGWSCVVVATTSPMYMKSKRSAARIVWSLNVMIDYGRSEKGTVDQGRYGSSQSGKDTVDRGKDTVLQ